ncbi:hypothetical protein J6590_045399 [Homalodisca vitripennis]|nr:hypothetical protein J6590_045399 [Homalodisca vitripennis]
MMKSGGYHQNPHPNGQIHFQSVVIRPQITRLIIQRDLSSEKLASVVPSCTSRNKNIFLVVTKFKPRSLRYVSPAANAVKFLIVTHDGVRLYNMAGGYKNVILLQDMVKDVDYHLARNDVYVMTYRQIIR